MVAERWAYWQETWFAASNFAPERLRHTNDRGLVVHAKRIGSLTAACGRDASSWVKQWEPFERATKGTSCPACVEAVALSTLGERRPSGRAAASRTG